MPFAPQRWHVQVACLVGAALSLSAWQAAAQITVDEASTKAVLVRWGASVSTQDLTHWVMRSADHQGLPFVVNQCFYEMLNSANQAWTMYPGLTHGAYECLHAHGTPEQKAEWLPRIASGEIACFGLTEQQAMRRVQIDTTSQTVRDTLQMPTSELIFEGRCD